MISGPLLASFAALLFGLSSPIAKSLLGVVNPWVLASLLYLGSGVGMGVIISIQSLRKRQPIKSINRRDVPWLIGLTLFGGVIGPVLLMYGLSRTPASTASLLLNLEGVLTAGLAWAIFREHFDRRIVTGMVAIIIGGVVLSWTNRLSLGGFAGPLFVAGACLSWAIDNNLTRKISLNDPVQITMIKSLVAGATNLALAFTIGEKLPAIGVAARAGALGFLCYGMSLICFILALRNMGAARTGAYFSTAPFIGAMIAIIFGHEPLTRNLVIAAALMGAGFYLHLTESHDHEHTHEEIEHEHSHNHDDHHQHTHSPDDPPGEPHTHKHRHARLTHKHSHFPDMHHTHSHKN